LQVKGLPVSTADILPEAIRIIKEQDDISSCAKEFDTIAMMGHRIGMLENSSGLKQYLQDVRVVLKPEGQILLTSIAVSAAEEPECQSEPALYGLQCQQANLIGPFFTIIRIKADKLKSQADAANWQCEFIYRQDDNNYVARLSLSDIF
jgi:cyclopropane fatty-acyl-phospholipid synthase-like methyltransferase